MIRFAMMRHGHTPWNRAGRIQGRTDIPLDDDGRAALEEFTLPADWQDVAVVASPLARAVETARIVTGQVPATVPALIEMDWGDWEGLHGLDLKADPKSGFRDIEQWGWDYRPPNGESPQDVWNRIEPWLMGLTRDTLAVCHIGTMRMILARATGWDFDGPAPFTIKRSRLYMLEIDDGDLRVATPDSVRIRPVAP
ncbi:histidine phosphatase family protein [Shimia biformata]|uniref:histidine phosphatase family protein n=1 Tax=Shimia biformata TaxID=1294299 RepID=UPI001950C7A8|nr:histidine phosphatase family protein [Shimia biformata]